jgi:hypothetical protein
MVDDGNQIWWLSEAEQRTRTVPEDFCEKFFLWILRPRRAYQY